jgi:outer membrane lipoprotein-sorting protein
VRRLAAGRFLIVAAAGQGEPADSAWVWLDRAGLPSRLEIREEPGERTAYRFSNWRFMRPRGRAAFVIAPPAGYEVVRLP